jgi:hypothetical protein
MENDLELLQMRVKQLERTVRLFFVITVVGLAFALTSGFLRSGSQQKDTSKQVLRARGLVIVDEHDRERILIGAPIPTAANRVRTDLARVSQIWGAQFGPKYMTWYKNYRNDMDGMLVLDENGFDRVAVGARLPDPNVGRRIGPATGIEVNDEQGWERGGIGLLNVKGVYRMVVGLDGERSKEGVILAVIDDGDSGVFISRGARQVFLGNSGSVTGEPDFQGLLFRQGDQVTYKVDPANPK